MPLFPTIAEPAPLPPSSSSRAVEGSGSSYLEPDFAEHYEKWKAAPGPRTVGPLLSALEPVSRSALTTYAGAQAKSPTLASRAKLLMLKALPSYDPSKSKLRTYMMYQLQSLRRVAAKEERIISAPEQVLLDQHHLHESKSILEDRLGREPSDQELADHTGLSRKRIGYVRSMRSAMAEGSMSRESEEGGMEPTSPAVEQKESGAWHEFVYLDLDPVDQLIMDHTLGMHGRPVLSNQELAARLRVSPGAVSQRKARIQAKLDQRDELNVF